MQSKDWKKVKNILQDVLELPVAERSDFLKNLDLTEDIKQEVSALLSIENEAEDMMNVSAASLTRDFYNDDEDINKGLNGKTIGSYQILKELGTGGMGAVYLAERTDGEFDQKVAIKMLRREFNTSEIRKRFKHEKEIQANLVHPNIARLIDAGTTEDDIPYIVMEYIQGKTIDNYCHVNGLSVEDRLKLFNKVCEAVAFAHRNLIIHRDLKPSNIIVSENGEPKLLDFGISKMLGSDIKEAQTVTKLGVMTPEYASPEQIKGESVTTSTDIYSLGIILFELLTGQKPYDDEFAKSGNIFKAILENEPDRPSDVLIKAQTSDISIPENEKYQEYKVTETDEPKTVPLGEDATQKLIKNTKPQFSVTNPKKLVGDIDNIILKSIRKEPDRRYGTVEQFSADIWRHLDGMPVIARPATFSYRASKFIKRNKVGVIAGGLILVAVVAGIITTLWQARIAREEAEKAQKINAFLQNVLNFSNPHWLSSNPKRDRNAKIVDALDESLKTIDTELANEPEVQAEILLTIGKTYMGQGKYESSQEVLEKALKKFNQIYGTDNPKSMQARVIIGESLFLRSKFKEAEKNYLEAVNYHRKSFDETDENRKFLAMALAYLSNIYGLQGDISKAEKLNRESMEVAENLTGKNKFVIPIVMGTKANVFHFQGKYQEALEKYKEALELMKVQGNGESFEGGQLLVMIGACYKGLKKYEFAEENLIKGYEVYKKTVGEKDFFSTNAKFRLGQIYFEQGKLEESEKILKENLIVQRELFPDGHVYNAYTEIMLGKIYTTQEKYIESERELRKALKYLSKIYNEPHNDIALVKVSLGSNLIAQQKFEEAEKYLDSALKSYVEIHGEEHPSVKEVRQELEKIK